MGDSLNSSDGRGEPEGMAASDWSSGVGSPQRRAADCRDGAGGGPGPAAGPGGGRGGAGGGPGGGRGGVRGWAGGCLGRGALVGRSRRAPTGGPAKRGKATRGPAAV